MAKREPLTRKARAAIDKRVELLEKKHGYINCLVIGEVLKADRMPRHKLYEWLEARGYRWNRGCWQKRKP